MACQQALLLASAAGPPVEIDAETAAFTRKQVGSPRAGWNGLQPLVEKVLAAQPELKELGREASRPLPNDLFWKGSAA